MLLYILLQNETLHFEFSQKRIVANNESNHFVFKLISIPKKISFWTDQHLDKRWIKIYLNNDLIQNLSEQLLIWKRNRMILKYFYLEKNKHDGNKCC